jgi:hypothetical protein
MLMQQLSRLPTRIEETPMSTTVTQLARFGISMEDARAFIEANLNNPQAIFNAAQTAGLTNGMLGKSPTALLLPT